MNTFRVPCHSRKILTMSAAALVLAAQASLAEPQVQEKNSVENWNLGFDYLDANQDDALSRDELGVAYELESEQTNQRASQQAGSQQGSQQQNQQDAFAEYDRDQDQRLNQEEYQAFANDPDYQDQRRTPYAADWQQKFNDVDEDDNNGAEWSELQQAYNPQLGALGWSEETILQKFDANNDGILDENEYIFFMTGLETQYEDTVAATSGGQQQRTSSTNAQQQQSQSGQQSIEQSAGADRQESDLTAQTQGSAQGLNQSPGEQSAADTSTAMNAGAAAQTQQDQRDQQAQANTQNQQSQDPQIQQDQMAQQNQQQEQGAEQGAADDPALVTTLISVTTVEPVPIEEIEGNPVYNLEGQQIGSVDDVVADTAQQQTGLVVSVGGFLGIGDKDILVPIEEVQLNEDRVVWQTLADEETLDNLPRYNAQDYVSVR